MRLDGAAPVGGGLQPHEIAEAGVALAMRLNDVRCCVLLVEHSSSARLRWAANTVTANTVSNTRNVTAIVCDDRSATRGAGGEKAGFRIGTVSRRVDRLDDVAALVEDASFAAHAAQPVEDEPRLFAPAQRQPSADWDRPAVIVAARALAALTPDLGEVLQRAAGYDRESFGQAQQEVVTTWLATSAGVSFRHEQPVATLQMSMLSHHRERSTWVGRAADDLAQLDPAGLERETTTRLAWQARRLELPPGRYEVVLPPECVADLMISLYLAADSRAAEEGRGPFARASGGTRVGERVSELPLLLRSNPFESGLGCAPQVVASSSSAISSVMDNGVPLLAQEWISDGIVQGLHTTRHSAARAAVPHRPAPGNLVLEKQRPGGAVDSADSAGGTTEDLAAGLDRGLLATSLWFLQEAAPEDLRLSGILRDGLYVIEAGEVAGVVSDRRFMEAPLDMLGRAVDAGATRRALGRDWGPSFSRTAMPALRVSGFEVGGATG